MSRARDALRVDGARDEDGVRMGGAANLGGYLGTRPMDRLAPTGEGSQEVCATDPEGSSKAVVGRRGGAAEGTGDR
jgi:hypothetical protein